MIKVIHITTPDSQYTNNNMPPVTKKRTYNRLKAPVKATKAYPTPNDGNPPIHKRTPIRKRTPLPDGYKPQFNTYKGGDTNKRAFHYALLGAEESVIAKFLGISPTTLNEWRRKYNLLDEAIRNGMDYACANVAHSLYQRALGYEYEEKEYRSERIDDINGETGEITTTYEMRLNKVTRKQVPADISAIKYFLYNRTKRLPLEQQWTPERQEITGKDGESFMLSPVQQQTNDEKARETRAAMLAALPVLDKPE